MSVTTGIFANYAFGLGEAGPSFIWTWPVVAVGNTVIALVLAHLATHVPLAGYAYQWPAPWCRAAMDGFLAGSD